MIFQAATTPESRKARPWIILYGHRPMYCSDDDGDDCTRRTTATRIGLLIDGERKYEPVATSGLVKSNSKSNLKTCRV